MEGNVSYTPEEIAKILKISKYTVYELIKRGELAAFRIGRKVRIEESDLEEYKRNFKKCPPFLRQTTVKAVKDSIEFSEGLIICGQDIVLDVLTRNLETHLPTLRFLRRYNGSMDGLWALYHGRVNLATAHLWDGDTGEYNIPYVRRLLPGQKTLIYNLVFRNAGFYVIKDNPKNIQTWTDLQKPGVEFVNRECGSGSRVLLDEKLRQLKLDRHSIKGYNRKETSHLAVASCVARGEADVGLGIEKAALQVPELDFIPLQKERYDLVFLQEDLDTPQIQTVLKILNSTPFQNEIKGMGGYDISQMGRKIDEV